MMIQPVTKIVSTRFNSKSEGGLTKSAMENFLTEAIRVCQRIRKDARDTVLGFDPHTLLTTDDLVRHIYATNSLEKALRAVENFATRAVDIPIDSICVCEVTVARFAGAGMHTLGDIRRTDKKICRAMLRLAEKAGAERQWHMHALVA